MSRKQQAIPSLTFPPNFPLFRPLGAFLLPPVLIGPALRPKSEIFIFEFFF